MKTSIAFISEAKGDNNYEKSVVFRTSDPATPFVRVIADELPRADQALQQFGVDPSNIFRAKANIDRPGQFYGGVKSWLATALEKHTASEEPRLIHC